MKAIGIYIHIPFCDGKCPYCDFYSNRGSDGDMDAYVSAVEGYLAAWSEKLSDRKVDTLYFGGGTPSLLGGERLSRLIKAVKENFTLADDSEITVEVNPRSSNGELFRILKQSGVNRISLGVQSFNEKELAFLGRRHFSKDAENTVFDIKNAGIDNISLDLMINLPCQTKESIVSSIEKAVSLPVKHVSAYMLKNEKGTAFEDVSPIDPDEAAEQYLFLCEELKKHGFEQYEISNFAVKGFESKHNLKYWRCEEYLGIGPAAHSFINRERFFYPRDTAAFINGNMPIPDGEGGSEEERIMLALRLTEGVNTSFNGREEKYVKAGLMKRKNGRLSFTPEGFLVSNTILAELIL